MEPEFEDDVGGMHKEKELLLVIASPKKQVVSPQVAPQPILKPSKYVVESDSIAFRVTACRTASTIETKGSIAQRVA